LAPHPRPWIARYVCAVAVVDGRLVRRHSAAAEAETEGTDNSARRLFETVATVEGEISPEPRGTNGFGYDPIFFYPPYGKTFGEVDDACKLAVAHRGVAFTALRCWLEDGEYQATTR